MGYILRFLHNTRQASEKLTGFLSSRELQDALKVLVRMV